MKTKYETNEISYLKNSDLFNDMDLPMAPKLEIYEETFGDLKNITEKWYKENRA